ncbi:unnamed protein product, partial [Nesidiocoris tenuis]
MEEGPMEAVEGSTTRRGPSSCTTTTTTTWTVCRIHPRRPRSTMRSLSKSSNE